MFSKIGFKFGTLAILVFSTLVFSLVQDAPANAGILDDITDAVVGHSKDIVGRFGEDEILPEAKTLRTGSFRSDDLGNDAAHNGEGMVSLVQKDGDYYVQFHPDFSSAFVPDPMIYVSSEARIFDNASFKVSDRQKLAALEKGSGASFVKVAGYDAKSIKSVTIWCERFGVFITSATLE